MLSLCETVDCRRVRLLNYFGETGTAACRNCDNCLTPPASWDATVAAQKLLSTIVRLDRERNQKFGAGQSIDILLGKRTEKVLQHRHESLRTFGIGTELSESEWRAVARQLLAKGLLAVEGDYSVLALTPASGAVLSGERTVMMRKEPERPARRARSTPKSAVAAELSGDGAAVFERLRAWRAATAKEQGVPAYVVFHDATLRAIASELPRTLDALSTISGVGENKLARYGEGILQVLNGAE
jgi:ATP-dependent DNA helicase RecQ